MDLQIAFFGSNYKWQVVNEQIAGGSLVLNGHHAYRVGKLSRQYTTLLSHSSISKTSVKKKIENEGK